MFLYLLPIMAGIPDNLHLLSRDVAHDILKKVNVKHLIDACEDEQKRPIIVSYLNSIELHIADATFRRCYLHDINISIPCINMSKNNANGCDYCIQQTIYIQLCEIYGIKYGIVCGKDMEQSTLNTYLSAHKYCTMLSIDYCELIELPPNIQYLDTRMSRADYPPVDFLVVKCGSVIDNLRAINSARNKLALIYCHHLDITNDKITELFIHSTTKISIRVPEQLTRFVGYNTHVCNLLQTRLKYISLHNITECNIRDVFGMPTLEYVKMQCNEGEYTERLSQCEIMSQRKKHTKQCVHKSRCVCPLKFASQCLQVLYYNIPCDIYLDSESAYKYVIINACNVTIRGSVKHVEITSSKNIDIDAPYLVMLNLTKVTDDININAPMLSHVRLTRVAKAPTGYIPSLTSCTIEKSVMFHPPTLRVLKLINCNEKVIDLCECVMLQELVLKNVEFKYVFVNHPVTCRTHHLDRIVVVND